MISVKLQDIKSIQKCFAFLHTNNKLSEREILKKRYTIALKTVKHLEKNLTKEVKDCTHTHENTIQLWWKKLKKTQINVKIFCVHGLEKLILLKCPFYPKQSTD